MPPVQKVNTNLTTLIEQLGAFAEAWIGVPSVISAISSNLDAFLVDTHAELEGIRTQLADMQATFGVAAGGPETTMASLLLQIQSNTACAQGICGPGPDDVGGCSDPFVSTGTVAGTDYGGRSFAVWDMGSLPDGITEGHFMDPEIANVQLVHAADGQWSLFVASQGSPTFSIAPDLDTVYPTNQWIDISANLDLAINTPTGTDVKAYICIPSDFPFVECLNINSVSAEYAFTNNGTPIEGFTVECIPFTFIGGIITNTSMTYEDFGTAVRSWGHSGSVVQGDVQGWTIEYVSGEASQITLEYVTSLGSHQVTNLGAPGLSFTMPSATSYFAISNRLSSSPDTSPFQVRICPPE